MSKICSIADRVRVYTPGHDLACLATADQAQKILASGAFRAVRRKRRIRALVVIQGQETAALQVIADLDRVTYEQHGTIRPGYSHTLGDLHTPRGVLTISRIPASIRNIFTSVVDGCTTGRAA